MKVKAALFSLGIWGFGCGAPAPPQLPTAALVLPGSDGKPHDVPQIVASHRLSVFVFYSAACPCLRVHEARLKRIFADYAARGVTVVLVNSEVSADAATDARETRLRGYPFLLLTDPRARLARALRAQFATHAVVVDARGAIRYSGGIDSDKNHLRPTATPYLTNALDDLLAGRPPRDREPEALGCALQLD